MGQVAGKDCQLLETSSGAGSHLWQTLSKNVNLTLYWSQFPVLETEDSKLNEKVV
jgi:hypothetical protein